MLKEYRLKIRIKIGKRRFSKFILFFIFYSSIFLTHLPNVLAGDPSLIAHWKFETETAGITPDETGVYDGTLVGATIINDAERGNVLSLDGINDYVTVANSNSVNLNGYTDSYSISVLVKSNRPAGTKTARVIEKWASGSAYPFSLQIPTSNNNVIGYIYDRSNVPAACPDLS